MLAPNSIKLAGTVMAPMKLAVSKMNASGGLSSGAFGIRDPVHPLTGTRSALIGKTKEQGRARIRAIVVGMRKLLPKLTRRLARDGWCNDGAGVAG